MLDVFGAQINEIFKKKTHKIATTFTPEVMMQSMAFTIQILRTVYYS